jgi:hypothetical protein
MWRWWGLAVLGCLGSAALALACGNAIVTPANPEDGKLVEGRYTNEYFNIAYPLPSGWSEERQGPAPSYSGYYVLIASKGSGGRDGTMLIAAQDQFFATDPPISSAEMVEQFRRQISAIDGMAIDHKPEEMTISGARFTRLDYSGVGLFRAMLVTESRCHFVSLNLTTNDPDVRASLAQSLNDLSLGDPADRARSMPICVKDYATPEHLLSRVNPTPAGPKYTSVPVRIIIGVDGRVRHIHVIRASAEQKENITAVLSGWQFRPVTMEGRAIEVETGVTFRF